MGEIAGFVKTLAGLRRPFEFQILVAHPAFLVVNDDVVERAALQRAPGLVSGNSCIARLHLADDSCRVGGLPKLNHVPVVTFKRNLLFPPPPSRTPQVAAAQPAARQAGSTCLVFVLSTPCRLECLLIFPPASHCIMLRDASWFKLWALENLMAWMVRTTGESLDAHRGPSPMPFKQEWIHRAKKNARCYLLLPSHLANDSLRLLCQAGDLCW